LASLPPGVGQKPGSRRPRRRRGRREPGFGPRQGGQNRCNNGPPEPCTTVTMATADPKFIPTARWLFQCLVSPGFRPRTRKNVDSKLKRSTKLGPLAGQTLRGLTTLLRPYEHPIETLVKPYQHPHNTLLKPPLEGPQIYRLYLSIFAVGPKNTKIIGLRG
jgi:hypothetical protein